MKYETINSHLDEQKHHLIKIVKAINCIVHSYFGSSTCIDKLKDRLVNKVYLFNALEASSNGSVGEDLWKVLGSNPSREKTITYKKNYIYLTMRDRPK